MRRNNPGSDRRPRIHPGPGGLVPRLDPAVLAGHSGDGVFQTEYLPTILLGLSAFLPGMLHAENNSKEAWRNLFVASAFFPRRMSISG